jgi:hypothetical protein
MDVGEDAEVGGAAEAGQVGWRGTVDDGRGGGPRMAFPKNVLDRVVAGGWSWEFRRCFALDFLVYLSICHACYCIE